MAQRRKAEQTARRRTLVVVICKGRDAVTRGMAESWPPDKIDFPPVSTAGRARLACAGGRVEGRRTGKVRVADGRGQAGERGGKERGRQGRGRVRILITAGVFDLLTSNSPECPYLLIVLQGI